MNSQATRPLTTVLVLVAVALTALPAALLWATVEGAIATAAWIAFFVLARTAGRGKPRAARLAMDVVAIVACAAGFFLGGLYWIPAALAFTLADRLDGRDGLAS